MRQVYFCTNCRAKIFYGERFCGNCGTSLQWVVVKTPPPYQNTRYYQPRAVQQTTQYPQPRQYIRQPSGFQEKAGPRPATQQNTAFSQNQVQHRQQSANGTRVVAPEKKHVPSEDPSQVLLNEVSELLEHLFQQGN